MKRAAVGALILVCCARQETPAPPPPPRHVVVKPAPVQPAPVPPRVWDVMILQSGGYSGGMRGYSVNSVNRTRCTPEQQALVASAVTAAHPESWARSYPDTSGGLTDQFYYTLTLEADGKKYVSGWSTGSGGVPPDLVRLAGAVRACH